MVLAGIGVWVLEELGADGILPAPSVNILASRGAVATRPHRLQGALSKLVSGANYSSFTAALGALPTAGRPTGVDNLCGGVETRDLTRVRHRSFCGLRSVTCL